MKYFQIILFTFCAIVTQGTVSQAKSLREATAPAEFPPEGYSAKQYVDSEGCVYIRAGQGATTSWIPRVNRSRNQVCGFEPSIKPKVAAKPVAPKVASKTPVKTPVTTPSLIQKNTVSHDAGTPADVSAPLSLTIGAEPPKKTAAPKPKVTQTTVSSSLAKPKKVITTAASKPKIAQVRPKAKTVQEVQKPVQTCAGGSAISQKYLQQNSKYAIRCGPQDQEYN